MIIEINNRSNYEQYEELLFKRDNYLKEADRYFSLYLNEFGDILESLFRKKVSCIKLKKSIEYCQSHIFSGSPIDGKNMEYEIQQQMTEYEKTLEELIENNKISAEPQIPSAEVTEKVNSQYKKNAKLIHPDINPLTNTDPKLLELWNRTFAAFHADSPEELENLEILINRTITNSVKTEFPDIEERIEALNKDIQKIVESEPYRYKTLLNDKELLADKKEDLLAELEDYTEYEKKLTQTLSEYPITGIFPN